MQTRFCVRRGHSAAVYTSVRWSTSVGPQNTIFIRGPHRCSSVYYRGDSIWEACTKQVKYCSLTKDTENATSWNSAEIDNCTPLPSNVSYLEFCHQISVC
ncbi:hypothetical protein AB205_0208020 [Aquarana catesbeiana]|uniref:Uncharacterized protein n=1 Tax=Aquarana catesbeiana TaxID=8400 RepID=A0A2G9Q566_AQUCT|nr:hypothetical protein AB205_0208020 [Aquarana catesbeiana]